LGASPRHAEASSINVTVVAESCNVQCGDSLGSFSASNDKDPLVISPGAAGSLCDIQAHTLGSSQSLIAQLRISDLCLLHRDKQLASDLISSQGFVWKSQFVIVGLPQKNGAAGEADDDERTTVEAQRELSASAASWRSSSSSKSLQAQ
jgi:hypothetical protein